MGNAAGGAKADANAPNFALFSILTVRIGPVSTAFRKKIARFEPYSRPLSMASGISLHFCIPLPAQFFRLASRSVHTTNAGKIQALRPGIQPCSLDMASR
ncbi:hypothetical protein AB4Y32_07735 [Paraburkholderia phymatum]|uniref:Uncharacterized protein n=1 Tax=Paraburkholderia phymatum TaxID=148447 RepID=A0ACC6TW72_9BURK